MKTEHTPENPLVLKFDGEYKVNKPNDQSGEYVSKSYAEQLEKANEELRDKLSECLQVIIALSPDSDTPFVKQIEQLLTAPKGE